MASLSWSGLLAIMHTVTHWLQWFRVMAFNIRLYATLCFNYFRWHRRMFSYGSVLELLICWLRNGVFNMLLGELYPRENEVIPEVRKRRGGWPGFEVFVWRRLTSCWIRSAMSPEIQEWSHKSHFCTGSECRRPTTVSLIVFTQRNFVADWSAILDGKRPFCVFAPPFSGLGQVNCNVRCSS